MKNHALCLLAFTAIFLLATQTTCPASEDAVPTLTDFRLLGDLRSNQANFTLSTTIQVDHPKGGSIELISGPVALTEIGAHQKWRLCAEQNRFIAVFDRPGKYPVVLKFNTAIRQTDLWRTVDFRVAPSALQPILLQGLAADTQFNFAGAARPERQGNDFVSYLAGDGIVSFSWKETRPEAEGKLFYATEMLSQITVSPGLMRQTSLLGFKVMQGELNRVVLRVGGTGEVTRVQGDFVLSWAIEPIANSSDRRLVVQLNQAQKDQFNLQVQLQTPLDKFPQSVEAARLVPEAATRFTGYCRIVNEGAVRLEVAQATGLSQISPDQFPESDLTRAVLRPTGTQRFAYRFSGPDCALRLQADQILPELTVSELLTYRLGENELAIDAEVELDVRDAPLRELLLRVPKGYVIAQLNASGLSDYFSSDPQDQSTAELRLVYGQPVSGRQLIQLRLERNKPLGEAQWTLPRIDVVKAKSVRGHVAVTADSGFRMTAERTQGLTEIATAFFPRKLVGVQAAFRLTDPAWEASLRVERLPQTIQADLFHLFSIGEGVAYGSSVVNYVISGAPVSAFKVELSAEYANVEFVGKDVRNWQKTDGGYVVQLHTPVSGTYALLATYERPFKAQGETLAFAGARPLDAQSEQGHTLIISAYQFQVKPVEVSPGLLALEPAEVPAEYRLFFDAPVLAAYRYASRPFTLNLALSPLTQGDSLSQVVDRALLSTRISKEGQVLTDVRYFVKNRGNPHFCITLPQGAKLWSATVNGAAVVPVMDGSANLLPLPQNSDPSAVLTLDLKTASVSATATRVQVAAPVVNTPVMLAEWKLAPDEGQRLTFERGPLVPATGSKDISAFGAIARTVTGTEARPAAMSLTAALVLLNAALLLWYWAGAKGVYRLSKRHVLGTLLGLIAFAFALAALNNFATLADHHRTSLPRELTFLVPVQQAGSALTLELSNVPDGFSLKAFMPHAWPFLLVLGAWIAAWLLKAPILKAAARILGWLLLAWITLGWNVGAQPFLLVLLLFLVLQVLWPVWCRLSQLPPSRGPDAPLSPAISPPPAVAALLLSGLIALNSGTPSLASQGPRCTTPRSLSSLPESITQDLHVDEKCILAVAKIRWSAQKGDELPILSGTAVLKRIQYPTNHLKLLPVATGPQREHRLQAQRGGRFDIEVHYELPVNRKDTEHGLVLPTPYGLVNQVSLTIVNQDVDVSASQAVSIARSQAGSNTLAQLVLSPARETWIGWRPRSRDIRSEKAVFYADLVQLYVPAAGVIEGAHLITIRPAQGELTELLLQVPAGATIADVVDPQRSASGSLVSLWRFDPDTRKLRITLNPPQSRPFTLAIRSQVATGPLPFAQTLGLITVDHAAGQIGLLGLATGNEVQLDAVNAEAFSPINLEDFPPDLASALRGHVPGLTVRRAFRYVTPHATATLKASPVEPDVRVETQDTLSLGEDRTVLACNATATITRAGIFRLSFQKPAGFEVESLSGSALSHWTEAKTEAGRVITLHLTGKTEGQQTFAITLAGPGTKATNVWTAPQLVLREAGKQRGTLLVVPEQGLRPQVVLCEGATQLDPRKSGIQQKGVLAFRVLQVPWRLDLGIEQVEPWIQVTSLQHAMVNEAQVKIAANLQCQIENTGIKGFRVLLPTNAESVRFQGEQIADFLPAAGVASNGLQAWDIKLHRRVLGAYRLRTTYQTPVPFQATEVTVRGVQVADVNLQRGFLTVQSGGRLQVQPEAVPSSLQATEWQSIPHLLQQDLSVSVANFAYRVVEPDFKLQLQIARHEVAKLLPARVNNVTLSSTISDDGVMLTQVRLEMLPGDKRLLSLRLPKNAQFWFSFVNQNGVWPWREQDHLLIPLEQQSRGDQALSVELFYSCQIGTGLDRSLDLDLLAPQFDLPLENISWRVSLNDRWRLKKWTGSLQLQKEATLALMPFGIAKCLG